MSRPTEVPQQDVGVGEGDSLPTYENLAQAHGPNSRYDLVTTTLGTAFSVSLVVQVRQVEKLGREEVTSITRIHYEKTLLDCSKEPQSDMPTSLRRSWSTADKGAGVRA
jgi:hypothetical protein